MKSYRSVFFLETNFFFLYGGKKPLYIIFHGPRVTESYKIKILYQLEDWEYNRATSVYSARRGVGVVGIVFLILVH